MLRTFALIALCLHFEFTAADAPNELENPCLTALFSSSVPLRLALTGEFERIHKANGGGNWTGESRDQGVYWTQGELIDLSDPQRSLQIRARARGMSSADDVSFPKLRVEISKGQGLRSSAFAGSRKFRINTHVSTNPIAKHTEMGRLNDERSPYREALAYDIARAFGLTAPQTRRARIEYTDTGLAQTFERNALLIETDKKIAQRLRAQVSEAFPESDKIPIHEGVLFHIFNIFIGNDDMGLKLKNEPSIGTENYRPRFNTTVFELADGKQFPMVYDFDLARLVTDWDAYPATTGLPEFGTRDPMVEYMIMRLALLRSRLSRGEYQEGLSDFRTRRSQILSTMLDAEVDEDGRSLALFHLDAFEKAIVAVDKAPMLLKDNVRLFRTEKMRDDEDMLNPLIVSETPGTLRPGTMIAVLQKGPQTSQIAVVDMKYDLKDHAQRTGFVHTEDLVLGFDLPEPLQGQVDERDMLGQSQAASDDFNP